MFNPCVHLDENYICVEDGHHPTECPFFFHKELYNEETKQYKGIIICSDYAPRTEEK